VHEQRRHERYPLTVEVELVDPSLGKCIVQTKDLSDGGLFLRLGAKPWPSVGSVVTVRVNEALGGGAAPPLLRARVVRVDADGIGLEFLLGAGP
jgi:hypothetical protein